MIAPPLLSLSLLDYVGHGSPPQMLRRVDSNTNGPCQAKPGCCQCALSVRLAAARDSRDRLRLSMASPRRIILPFTEVSNRILGWSHRGI